jgi:hypothetical protein
MARTPFSDYRDIEIPLQLSSTSCSGCNCAVDAMASSNPSHRVSRSHGKTLCRPWPRHLPEGTEPIGRRSASSCIRACAGGPPRVSVGDLRAIGLDVERAPIDDEDAHVHVVGEKSRALRHKIATIARYLREAGCAVHPVVGLWLPVARRAACSGSSPAGLAAGLAGAHGSVAQGDVEIGVG